MYYIHARDGSGSEQLIGKTQVKELAVQMAIAAIQAGWQSVRIFDVFKQADV